MASNNIFRIIPPVEYDEEENTHSPDHQIQNRVRSLDGAQAHLSEQLVAQYEELVEYISVDTKTDASVRQPEPSQYPMTREELYKRCHWFDDFEEPVGTSETLSPCQSNVSRLSPKLLYRQVKSRWQVSPTRLSTLEDEEDELGLPAEQLAAGSKSTSQTVVQVCLPPGCIPSNVIVDLSREESRSGTEAAVTVMADDEVDIWVEDICKQTNFEQAGNIFPLVETDIDIVHDLGDVWPENSYLATTTFSFFVQSKKAPCRRNAICEELEMLTGFVKVNGAKFSLWHLRKDLLKALKLRKL